jgi:hypothetical protein
MKNIFWNHLRKKTDTVIHWQRREKKIRKYEEKPKPPIIEEIKNRPKEFIYGTKEETFLWAYETIFNWLGINFDSHHKEQI